MRGWVADTWIKGIETILQYLLASVKLALFTQVPYCLLEITMIDYRNVPLSIVG